MDCDRLLPARLALQGADDATGRERRAVRAHAARHRLGPRVPARRGGQRERPVRRQAADRAPRPQVEERARGQRRHLLHR